MCPAECSVLAYVLPGFPIEHTSRGYAVCTAFFASGIEAGIEDVPSGLRWRDFLGGLFGGVRDSESVSDGVRSAESCFCFFNCRRSLRLRGIVGVVKAMAESASLSSGVDMRGISGSSAGIAGAAIGLATCARVVAFAMTLICEYAQEV